MIMELLQYLHSHILYLNNSKFFAGIVMILLNIGSKLVAVQFSESAETYLKMNISKQIIVFAMAWMGTRDIYTALSLVAVFTILSEHLMNDKSNYCIIPYRYRVLSKAIDTNSDNNITTEEINRATQLLEAVKKQERIKHQKSVFADFHSYNIDTTNT